MFFFLKKVEVPSNDGFYRNIGLRIMEIINRIKVDKTWMKFHTVNLLAVLFFFIPGFWQQTYSFEKKLQDQDLLDFLENTRTASGSFSQKTFGTQSLRNNIEQRGTFSFTRSGEFRLCIEYPQRQSIISNGKSIFQYDPELKQVLIINLEQLKTSPIAVLFDLKDFRKSFNIQHLSNENGTNLLRMVPKSKIISFEHVDLCLKDKIPIYMEFLDFFEKKTRIDFPDVSLNVVFSPDEFNFLIPEGSDVFRM